MRATQIISTKNLTSTKTIRIAFVCVENSCRSQMAEAIAKKLCNKPNIEFLSAGTSPANECDQKALEVLKEEGIIWHGKPKKISLNKEPIDIVVTMGCEVVCPTVPGTKQVEWNIEDPKGKDIEDYRKTLRIIKEKVANLLKDVNKWQK